MGIVEEVGVVVPVQELAAEGGEEGDEGDDEDQRGEELPAGKRDRGSRTDGVVGDARILSRRGTNPLIDYCRGQPDSAVV